MIRTKKLHALTDRAAQALLNKNRLFLLIRLAPFIRTKALLIMFKPFAQIFTALSCFSFLLLLSACSTQTLSKEDLIERSENFLKNKEPQSALDLINAHGSAYLDDPELLFITAQSHQQLNDPFTASAILLSAIETYPENTKLLEAYFFSLKAAEMSTDSLLIQVAEQSPGSLTQEDWLRVSLLYENNGDLNAAIKAHFRYLGSDKAQKTTPLASALVLAQYFQTLEESKQAIPWLTIVAESDSIEALPAQLNLLKIELDDKRWKALEKRIAIIETRFPGALAGSSFSELPKIIEDNLSKSTPGTSSKQLVSSDSVTASTKTGGIQDIKDLEAFANRVAEPISAPLDSEADSNSNPALEAPDSLAEFNPEIRIEPADPFLESDSLNVINNPSSTPKVILSEEAIASMLEEANRAVLNNELDTATQLYRKILEDNANRPVIWNQIAQVYLANEEFNSAENAALEAIRKAPENITYTLNYLKIAKNTKSEIRFLSELSSAAKQFPNSPEIALSLARAYDRNLRYKFRAKEYYMKFITLDPNHPQRAEAEAAISRLP